MKNTDKFSGQCATIILEDLITAGLLNESAVFEFKNEDLLENYDPYVRPEQSPYQAPIQLRNGIWALVRWDEFARIYLNYHEYPTRDSVMNALELHVDRFVSKGAYRKTAERLVKFWTDKGNKQAIEIAQSFAGGRLPSFSDRQKMLANLDDVPAPETGIGNIDYGRRGQVRAGSRQVGVLNNTNIIPGQFYNDVSRIPKHRYTGWLKKWEQIVNATKKLAFWNLLKKKWIKSFILGYQFGRNTVIEIWYDTIDSTFAVYDHNGVEVGRRSATLQEATRIFMTFILQKYTHDEDVFKANDNVTAQSYMAAISSAVTKSAIDVERSAKLSAAEQQRIDMQQRVGKIVSDAKEKKSRPEVRREEEKRKKAFRELRRKKEEERDTKMKLKNDQEAKKNSINQSYQRHEDTKAHNKADWSSASKREREAEREARAEKEYKMRSMQKAYDGNKAQNKADWSSASRSSSYGSGMKQEDRAKREDEIRRKVRQQRDANIEMDRRNKPVIALPDLSEAEPITITVPSSTRYNFDGLTDADRKFAVQLYNKYQNEQKEARRKVNQYNTRLAKISNAAKRTQRKGDNVSDSEVKLMNNDIRSLKQLEIEARQATNYASELDREIAELAARAQAAQDGSTRDRKINQMKADAQFSVDDMASIDKEFQDAKDRRATLKKSNRKGNGRNKRINESINSHNNNKTLPDDGSTTNLADIQNYLKSTAVDNEAKSLRRMAEKSPFTAATLNSFIMDQAVKSYDKTRAGDKLRSPKRFSGTLIGSPKLGFIKRKLLGRDTAIYQPTDTPTTWDRMKMVLHGTAFRADFVIGFTLSNIVDLEVWYVTEPDPNNPKTTISSYYVFDVTAGITIRRNLPYYRNAIQVIMAKIGVE